MKCKNCGHRIEKKGNKWFHAYRKKRWIFCRKTIGVISQCRCKKPEPKKEKERFRVGYLDKDEIYTLRKARWIIENKLTECE